LKCLQEYNSQGYVKNIVMHEIRIAEELTGIVLEVACREKLSKVTKVNISFGQLIQIVPDIFNFAFREGVRDTIATDAVVDIEILPVKIRCRICNNEIIIKDNSFRCNKCGSSQLDIIQGKELFVKSIEGE
jgi:hydrogenase nickel incorporation protein HypA/HybF